MKSLQLFFKSGSYAAGGAIGYFLGGWDKLILVLFLFSIIDYGSGMIAGWMTGTLNSKVGFRGLAKKVMMFAIVGVCAQLDIVFRELGLDFNVMFREAAIVGYIVNELLSITENAGRIGIWVPEPIAKAVEVLQGRTKQTKGEDL